MPRQKKKKKKKKQKKKKKKNKQTNKQPKKTKWVHLKGYKEIQEIREKAEGLSLQQTDNLLKAGLKEPLL